MFRLAPNMALGARIKHYRLRLGWTLETLSDRSNVDLGTIGALEVRDSKRSIYTPQLAKAFGLSVEQLLDSTRDWLDPEVPPSAHRVLAGPPASYTATRWLFSAELFEALQHKKARELDHIENIVRAHLAIAPLAPRAEKRARA